MIHTYQQSAEKTFLGNMKVLRYLCYQSAAVFIFTLRLSLAIEKKWVPDLEWQTATNWENNHVPEVDSHVIFPLETRHAVGIAKSANLKLSKIDLPRSGYLVLSKDGSLELSESKVAVLTTARWVKQGNLFWADPNNWHGSPDAAPHLERVPCRMDNIVLPEADRTITVFLPTKEIEVRSIRTLNQRYPLTKWQWKNFEGYREFTRGRFTVKYSEYSCEKCSCQDDPEGDYLEEVCAIQRPRCGITTCEYPLTVEGHCCRYCGGRISLSKKASLPIVGTGITEALEGHAEKISWHVRRTANGVVEVLVMEKGDYSGVVIQEAIEYMKKHLQNSGIEVLGTETAGAALQNSRLATAFGPLFITPLILLILLLIGCSYFGYSFGYILAMCTETVSSIREGIQIDKQQDESPFSFARFENISDGNVHISDIAGSNTHPVESIEVEGDSAASGGRFENPLYTSNRCQQEEKEIMNIEIPLSLVTLTDKVECCIDEAETDTDQLRK